MAESTNLNRGSSDEIRANIERTRAEMDHTFDALDEKLTPAQLLQEAWHYTKGGSAAGANKLWQLAREHPLPATLIGVGIGWMFVERARGTGSDRDYDGRYAGGRYSSRYAGTGEGYAGYRNYGGESYYGDRTAWNEDWDEKSGRLGDLKDAAGNAGDLVKEKASHAAEAVGDAVDTVKEKASGAVDTVKEAASTAKEKAADLSNRAKETASELSQKARTQTRRAKIGFWQMLDENPLAVGAATLVLGVLAGFSIPSTDKENELLGETRDQFLDSVKETSEEVLEKGKHLAEAAVDKVKDEAQAQGLTPDNLVEKVKAVGRETANAVQEEAKKQGLTGEGDQANAGGNQPQGAGAQAGSQPGSPLGTSPQGVGSQQASQPQGAGGAQKGNPTGAQAGGRQQTSNPGSSQPGGPANAADKKPAEQPELAKR